MRERKGQKEKERRNNIHCSLHFCSFRFQFKNEDDMLIPPGPNTRTKEDLLPSPDILELIDAHVSEVSKQPRLYIIWIVLLYYFLGECQI